MWIETIDGNMVNSQQATGIQTTEASGRYEVHIEVPVANQSRNPMRTVFRSEDIAEYKAFMIDLKDALPMLPIGAHKAPPRKEGKQVIDNDEV